jgi:predicted nucleic acid-binding protein
MMLVYLLDTNIISELRRSKPHGGVVAWIQAVPDDHLHVSAVSLGEIQAGIEITREQNPEKADVIERWADRVAGAYEVLPMDGETFRIWARLMHRRSDTIYEDAMIAATALRHGLTVVTRNTRDFIQFGQPLENPFEPRRT